MKLFKISLLVVGLLFNLLSMAQVAINNDGSTPDGLVMFEIKSSMQGLLIPMMSATNKTIHGNSERKIKKPINPKISPNGVREKIIIKLFFAP